MPTSFKNSFINGTDIDSDELRIRPNALRFLKNLLWNVNRNSQASSTEGNNAGVLTPLESTVHLTSNLNMGAGLNYCCGYKESRDTNEGFVFIYNTRGNHMIYSVSGKDGSVQIVYRNANLKFKYNPENFINESRCVVRVFTYVDTATGLEAKRTFIIFTDATNTQRFICKEDSINTSWFQTAFFNPKATPSAEVLAAREQYINLGVEPPSGCIGIESIEPQPGDELKQNALINKGWQFRTKNIDVYGRESEHGFISERYFLITGSTCISNSLFLPRCLNLKIDAGNPFVNKIQIEYRTCTANTPDLSNDSGWFLYDVIDKYESDLSKAWYQKSINPNLTYTSLSNIITYKFCADRLAEIINPAETTRQYNPLPITSDSLFALNKGIGLANNRRDFEPISPQQLEKINFNVTPTQTDCDVVPRSITVYGIIWYTGTGADPGQTSRVWYSEVNNLYYFSVNENASAATEGVPYAFRKGVSGFIGYMAGTNYAAISTQVVLYLDDYTEGAVSSIDMARPYFIVQKWVFTVVPGKYVFRIASNLVLPSEDFQKTSTFVQDTVYLDSTHAQNFSVFNLKKELLIDVCNADFKDTRHLLRVSDAFNAGNPDANRYAYGYLYESAKEKIPIELAVVNNEVSGPGQRQVCMFTDHNGFFFAMPSSQVGSVGQINISLYVDDCVTIKHILVTNSSPGTDYHGIDAFVYTIDDLYPAVGRRLIKGRMLSCDGKIGLPGIPVVLEDGAYTYTDNNGYYTIIAHNRMNNAAYASFAGRIVEFNDTSLRLHDWTTDVAKILVTQNGLCQIVACGSCDMCFPDYTLAYQNCSTQPRTYNFGVLSADVRGLNQSGPKNGGRYGIGMVFEDWMGRKTFVQSLDKHFVDIPSIQEIKAYAFSRIGFTIESSFQVSNEFKRMNFCITENLNWGNDLTWVVDRVEFLDAVGAVSASSPVKIRLYYESIVEYASQNNFSTNTVWQFLKTDGGRVTGDRVEFIKRPTGEWYDEIISSQVRYDKDGVYFEIDYDSKLADLQDGTQIKLIRPRAEEQVNLYFELCPQIRLANGVPTTFSGTFDYKDSYNISRIIPTPQYVIDPVDPTKIDRSVVTRAYVYTYEHHSPSDFWGDHCRTQGRVNVKNAYERRKRLGSEVALSKALVNKSNFNGLSYFDEADIEVFNEHEWGNITAVLPENNTVLVLCERDNFVVGFNDTLARTLADGTLSAPSVPDRFGKPQRKLGSNYGCRKRDINTIQKRNGIVVFLDSNKSELVFHTFGDATDISKMTLTKAWVEPAVKTVKVILNDGNNKFSPYFVGGVDPKNNEYYLTKFAAFRDPVAIDNGPESILVLQYINQLADIDLQANETLVYSLEKGNIMFKGFVSPTPEYYGTLEGYYLDSNMLMMKQATAHSMHNAAQGGTYNNFFGTQCKKVIVVVANAEPEEVKRFLWTEVFCKEHVFTADKVRTEAGQLSRIKLGYWQKADNFYTAPYLCDLNTLQDTFIPVATGVNKLLDGDVMYGRWIETRYVSEAADDAKYCEVSAIEIHYVDTKQKSE